MDRSEYDANRWLHEFLRDGEEPDELPDTSGLSLVDDEPETVGYDPRNYRGREVR